MARFRMPLMSGRFVRVALIWSVGMGLVAAAQAPAKRKRDERALAMQVLLDRAGFSPGEIDGKAGANLDRARSAYAAAHADQPLESDADLLKALGGDTTPTVVDYVIQPADVAGPFAPIPESIVERAKLPALGYASAIEALGESFHAAPGLLRQLNPSARFEAGESIRVPNIVRDELPPAGAATPPAGPAVTVTVSKQASTLTVRDESGRVLFAAPVTSGSDHDPLPLGTWTVTGISRNPRFNYNPDLFWDAKPGDSKVRLPAGPNSPVGSVWIDLTKDHYGLHGTEHPESVGHKESHGCVRLTNWDALKLASFVRRGTPVIFEP
jgi:lipoprotein-anchoring transpeptidase ErfK/SrfK